MGILKVVFEHGFMTEKVKTTFINLDDISVVEDVVILTSEIRMKVIMKSGKYITFELPIYHAGAYETEEEQKENEDTDLKSLQKLHKDVTDAWCSSQGGVTTVMS